MRTLLLICGLLSLSCALLVSNISESKTVLEGVFHRTETGRCLVLSLRPSQQHRGIKSPEDVVVAAKQIFTEQDPGYGRLSKDERPIEELRIYAMHSAAIHTKAKELCSSYADNHIAHNRQQVPFSIDSQASPPTPFPLPSPPLEIQELSVTGLSINRIDLVFFSDGYTVAEHDKFLSDARRLAKDIIGNQTFATVSPLLNIWAAFSPSNESGIGTMGQPKDTVFGLYRDGTELRAVYTSKKLEAYAACFSMSFQCDYPILLGNDPLYGGLGGMFTITTASQENGALVLRHELGHSIISVGEEYDGGFAYHGVNAQDNITDLKWSHWLTDQSIPARAERSVMPLQGYPWTILNHSQPYVVSFDSSGLYSRHLVRFSLSGFQDEKELVVSLDGEDLGWKPRRGLGVDRWHYDIYMNESLSAGEHVLRFELMKDGNDKIAQLCSYEILEFGDETEFNAIPGHVSAFPTFSTDNMTTYRPTNEDCLMRIVTTPNFCSPCIEGLWLTLLSRVNFVDYLISECHSPDDHSDTPHIGITFGLLPLGQWRLEGQKDGEFFTTKWTKDGAEISKFENETTIFIDNAEENAKIQFSFELQLHTNEVRKDPDNLLKARYIFRWLGRCGEEEEAVGIEVVNVV